MTVAVYERENAFTSTVTWMSSNSYVDPSGNMSFIKVYDPNGTLYISASGVRTDTGIYHYRISTQSDAELGLWKIRWHALFSYESPFSYLPKSESEVIQLVDVAQT